MKITNQSMQYTPTTIQHETKYVSESDRRMEMLRDKYGKIHQQNLRQPDPKQHIYDKYDDRYSPKFRSDLTKEERDAAIDMELSMLRNDGKMGYYSFRDAAFRDMEKINGLVENAEKRAFQRQQVNNQMGELFKEAGIVIPSDANLTFTVNPNDFAVTVTGSDDEQLLRQIEDILNKGKNGQELYKHLFRTVDEESSQRSKAAEQKYSVVSTLRATGYDISKLENKDGKFLTPDGQDAFELYLNKMRANPYERNYVSAAASHYGPTYYALAKNGFDSMPDFTLSINYRSGQLHDIGQTQNYSETGWIDTLKQHMLSLK
ncbi:MAG: DUF4885 family protein [Caryophanon sp.]|nr:DUF4885 family protein [Caryophanon sp.]